MALAGHEARARGSVVVVAAAAVVVVGRGGHLVVGVVVVVVVALGGSFCHGQHMAARLGVEKARTLVGWIELLFGMAAGSEREEKPVVQRIHLSCFGQLRRFAELGRGRSLVVHLRHVPGARLPRPGPSFFLAASTDPSVGLDPFFRNGLVRCC